MKKLTWALAVIAIPIAVLLLMVLADIVAPYEPDPYIKVDWYESANALDIPADSLTWDIFVAHERLGPNIFKVEPYASQIKQMRGQ